MMTRVLDGASILVAAAGVAAWGVAGVRGGRWLGGLAMALTLWTAAGLLRLTGEPSWQRAAAAAAVIAVRHLARYGVRHRAAVKGA